MKDETNDHLDLAIDAVRADTPAENEITGAAERVRVALGKQRGPQAVMDLKESSAPGARWDSIDDYIAAIPAYLAHELSPAQHTLFEEEAHQSVPLSRALNQARGRHETAPAEPAGAGNSHFRWLALAATVCAVAVALVLALPQLPSLNQSQLGRVATVDGQLYQLIDGRLESLAPGTWIDGRQRIRSATGSRAFLTLDDGSEIEMDGRSELSLTRRGAGNRIDVSRGRILVHAAPQAAGTLDVFTNEMEVSVTGTIFEVAHGAKGSRVAVVEGSVDVLLQNARHSLEPGDVIGSRAQYLAQNVADEIAWSENADDYIAMLQEVAALQEDLQAVMDTPPRYSTRLLDLAPEDTAVYIAVPNAPEKIAEVYEVVRARTRGNQYLSNAWAEFESAAEGQYLDEIMAWVREIGYALGNETVFITTMAHDGAQELAIPIVLSEVDAQAFTASVENQEQVLRDILIAEGQDPDALELALIDDPALAREDELSILLLGDILVASIDPAMLARMADIIAGGGSAFADSEFRELLQYSYDQGTQILGAVDIARLTSTLDLEEEDAGLREAGLDNIKYLIAEHRQDGDWSSITGDLYFDGPRRAVMSWVAAPAPMGSLEFFSTDTTVVAALLLREPISIVEDLDPLVELEDPEAREALALFTSMVAVLGGEVAVGLDGPALPTPSWKAVVEAYDPALLQEGIEWSARRLNEAATEEGIASSVEIVAADVGAYPGYRVIMNIDPAALDELEESNLDIDFSAVSFHYAFVDGYLVAAPNAALIDRAIGFYRSGSGLQTDADFRALLARDGYLDFSGLYFSRLGQLVSDVVGSLPTGLTAEQREAIDSLNTDIGPSMISLLALEDRLHIAHSGSTEWPARVLSQMAVFAPLIEQMEQDAQAID